MILKEYNMYIINSKENCFQAIMTFIDAKCSKQAALLCIYTCCVNSAILAPLSPPPLLTVALTLATGLLIAEGLFVVVLVGAKIWTSNAFIWHLKKFQRK